MKNYTFRVEENVATQGEYEDIQTSLDMGGFSYVDSAFDASKGAVSFSVGIPEWSDV